MRTILAEAARRLSPRRSIRTRLTVISAAVLLAGLTLGAVAFDRLLEDRLLSNLDQTLRTQAVDRALAVDSGVDPTTVVSAALDETAIAVLDPTGSVIASRGFADPSQIEGIADGTSTRTLLLAEDEPGHDEVEIERYQLRVAAVSTATTTVVVASELETVDRTLADATQLLLLGVPLITAAGATLVWLVADRSLRPVERLRADAEAIATSGAHAAVGGPRSDDELGRLASTLNDMLERLEAGSSALRQFVSDASHEIRSPIANIRARIETADPERWADARADVIGEVERVESVIDDLSFLARSDEGQLTLQPERIELDEVLFDEVVRLQQRAVVAADASAVEPVVAAADRRQLRRVVRNLVDNAERHAETRVAVGCTEQASPAGATAVITVDDDGPGIPDADRTAVFERFRRLDDSRQRATGGTGLGLAIVLDIVDRHGGSVEIATSALGGARFVVTLPLERRDEHEQGVAS